ncbi:MAG: Gfo/Idh/MocA family oxidoreductase [Clostridia bacterium]
MQNDKTNLDKTFGWAFIGCGAIAHTVAKEIVKSGKHKIVSVFSRTKARAQEFALKYGATAYDTLEDAINCKNVDGVYIATPHSAHYKNILEALNCGKPILCEKSFTINSAQTQEVLKRAEDKKVFIAEAMWTRFNPLIVQLRRLIASGELGKICSVKAAFCVPLWASKPFVAERVYKKEYGGGALLDLGVYPVSFCQMLLGKPDSVDVVGILNNGIDVDNVITLKYNNAQSLNNAQRLNNTQSLNNAQDLNNEVKMQCSKQNCATQENQNGVNKKPNATVCTLYASLKRLKSYTAKIACERGIVTIPMFYRPSKMKIKLAGMKPKTLKTHSGYIYQFDAIATAVFAGKTEMAQISHSDTIVVMTILDEVRAKLNHKYADNIESL